MIKAVFSLYVILLVIGCFAGPIIDNLWGAAWPATSATLATIVSGVLFASGWWLVIVSLVCYQYSWVHLGCALLSTCGMGLLAGISRNEIGTKDAFYGESNFMARSMFFLFLTLIFGGAALSSTMSFVWYAPATTPSAGFILPPVGIFCIALSAYILKFGRPQPNEEF